MPLPRPPASLAWMLALVSCAPGSPPAASPSAGPPSTAVVSPPAAPMAAAASAPTATSALRDLQRDAARLAPLVTSPLAKRLLGATAGLPSIAPRKLFRDADKTRFYTEREAGALPEAAKAALVPVVADEELYYNTRYGSPLSYARPLDLLAQHGRVVPERGRVLDFGYGYVGHLRLLASLGFDATGIDVDPLLRALYAAPGDQGEIRGAGGASGKLRLLDGRFPADPAIVAAAGVGYDLVLSKNVLKRGYIHPERPADPKRLIQLGAPDEVVLKRFFELLRPGGTMLVYNICPAFTPPDKPYVPWSDGRSPFTVAQWEAAGFRVLVFDRDDTAAVRAMGRALGWDQPPDPMDLEHDLSVLYTLLERPPS